MSETGDPMERSRLGFVLLRLGVASLCVWVSFLISLAIFRVTFACMSVAILVRAVRVPDLSRVVNLGTYLSDLGFLVLRFLVGIGEPVLNSEMLLEVLLPRFHLSEPGGGVLTVSTELSVPEMYGVIDTILAGCAVPNIGLSKPVGRSRISGLIWSISSGGMM